MGSFTKLSTQVPPAVRERFMALPHGHKQLACTAGLALYFSADEKTQRLYRIWAQDIGDESVPSDELPESIEAAIRDQPMKPARRAKKKKR